MAKSKPQTVAAEAEPESTPVSLSDLTPRANSDTPAKRGRPEGSTGKNLVFSEERTKSLLRAYGLFGLEFEDIAETLKGDPLFAGYEEYLTPLRVKGALRKAFVLLRGQGVDLPEIPRKKPTRKDKAPALAEFFKSLQQSA